MLHSTSLLCLLQLSLKNRNLPQYQKLMTVGLGIRKKELEYILINNEFRGAYCRLRKVYMLQAVGVHLL
jgi:hypothetical protein